MSRNRLLTLALIVCSCLALPATAQIGFGDVNLGEIDTTCLSVCFGNVSNCDGDGTINQVAIDPPFHVRGLRIADIDDDFCANQVGDFITVARLPVNLQSGQVLVFDVDLVADEIGSFDEVLEINGGDVANVQATVLPPATCPPSATDLLCFQNDRFQVRSFWRTKFGTRGNSPIVQNFNTDDSGLYYFFNPNNWEILVKVLDGCNVNDRFWVFAAATTNVEFWITVTDTASDNVKSYFNPLNRRAQPIQDTNAFATCP